MEWCRANYLDRYLGVFFGSELFSEHMRIIRLWAGAVVNTYFIISNTLEVTGI